MKAIYTQDAPQALGTYSQAILAKDTLYLSGQIGIDPNTGQMAQGFDAQARQVMDNLDAVLKAADMDFSLVVKFNVSLVDLGDFDALNQVFLEYLSAPYPARAAVQVAALPKSALVEIEAIAVRV